LLFLSLVAQGTIVLVPILLQITVDELLPTWTGDGFRAMGFGIAIVTAALVLASAAHARVLDRLTILIDRRMAARFVQNLVVQPCEFFADHPIRDLTMRSGSARLGSELFTRCLACQKWH